MTPGQEALHEAARMERARIYGTVLGQAAPAEMAVIVDVPGRTLESTYGAAPAEVLREVVDALSPVRAVPPVQTTYRKPIEQAIARGLDNASIVADLHVPLADVEHVRTDLDRLSA